MVTLYRVDFRYASVINFFIGCERARWGMRGDRKNVP